MTWDEFKKRVDESLQYAGAGGCIKITSIDVCCNPRGKEPITIDDIAVVTSVSIFYEDKENRMSKSSMTIDVPCLD